MSERDSEDEKDGGRGKKRDWNVIVGKIIKALGVTLGLISVAVILVIGLVLGACFLSSR